MPRDIRVYSMLDLYVAPGMGFEPPSFTSLERPNTGYSSLDWSCESDKLESVTFSATRA